MPLTVRYTSDFSPEKKIATLNIHPIFKCLISETLRCKNTVYIYILKLRKYTVTFCYRLSILWGATDVYKEVSPYTKSLTNAVYPERSNAYIVNFLQLPVCLPYQALPHLLIHSEVTQLSLSKVS